MKIIVITIAFLIFISGSSSGQQTVLDSVYYYKKLNLLSYDQQVKSRVKITASGIHYVYHPNNARAELSILWSQVKPFLEYAQQHYGRMSLVALYKNPTEVLSAFHPHPTQKQETSEALPLAGKRIAIDASKFATSMDEARKYDPFYVKLHKDSVGTNEDIELLESELNQQCAVMVAHWLRQQGAEVVETRPLEEVVFNNFDRWMKDSPAYWTDMALKKGWIDQTDARLYRYSTDPYELVSLFKKLNLRYREERINSFSPDLCISISFNASEETASRSPGMYSPVVDKNACIAIVGGSYHLSEFSDPEHVVQLFYQLLSDNYNRAIQYGSDILSTYSTHSGIKKLHDIHDHHYMRNNTVATDYDGVYARNLFITRAIAAPTVVIYPGFQNNAKEALLLSDRSVVFETTAGQKFNTSLRLVEISQMLAKAICDALLKSNE